MLDELSPWRLRSLGASINLLNMFLNMFLELWVPITLSWPLTWCLVRGEGWSG
jgi:hypothetical protein